MKFYTFLIISLFVILSGCSNTTEEKSSAELLFDEFWTFVDENYIYFELKEVNWDEVYSRYSNLISEVTTEEELFTLMESALLELKDNHNRLVKSDRRAKTYDFKKGYSIYHSLEIIEKNYYKTVLGKSGNMEWALLQNNVGYLSFPDFNNVQPLRSVFVNMNEKKVDKFIIDVRGNGGGDSNSIPDLLSILAKEKTLIGSYIEKSGPKHNEVTEWLKIYATPDNDLQFDVPIVVLTDRASYSATSYFAAMIGSFDSVTLMGQITGGGGGGNLGYQLSNGWLVAVSVSDFLDAEGESIENGVIPDVEVSNTLEDIQNGKDVMLERAMAF